MESMVERFNPGGELRFWAQIPSATASPVMMAVVVIVALVIVVLLYQLFRRNADRIAPTLERLGAEIPKPGDADDNAPTRDDMGDLKPFAPSTRPEPIVMPPAASGPTVVADEAAQRIVALDGRAFTLPEQGTLTLGRERDNAVAFPDEASISRRHAIISRQGEVVTLTDLDSTNGTFLDGVRITEATALRPGQSVRLGSVELRVE